MAEEVTPRDQTPEGTPAAGAPADQVQESEVVAEAGDVQEGTDKKADDGNGGKAGVRQRQHSFPLYRMPGRQPCRGGSILF